MNKSYVLIGASILALGGAVAGTVWWRAAKEHAAIVAALPAEPDVSRWSPELHQRIKAAESGSVAGLAELSRLYHANGYYTEAEQCYRVLEKLQPNEPRWPHRHATLLAGYGDAEPALALWRRVEELAPDYLPARIRMGDMLLKINRRDEAAAAYRDILQRKPDEPYAQLGLARLAFDAGEWEEARSRLEKLVAQTNYNLGYDLIVTVYEHFGQNDAASAIRARDKASGAYRDPVDPWIDELIDVCYDPYRLSTVAGFAAGRGDTATAVRLLQRAIELGPNDVGTRFQYGLLCVDQHNYSTALEQFQRCTEIAPSFSDGWAQLSSLQAQMGDSAAADRTLATGLEKCPQSPGLHLMKARYLRKGGHIGESIGELRTSIRLRPNEPDAYIEYGTLLIGLGRVDEGVAQLQLALDASPDHPGALAILAFHAITTGNEADARRWLARVARQPRVEPQQASQLAGAYRQQFGHDWAP